MPPPGSSVVTSALTSALVGRDELLHQRQVDREDAGITDADKDPEEYRNSQPGIRALSSGVNTMIRWPAKS